MISDETSRKYAKVSEMNGVDRPASGVHKGNHSPEPFEVLRLIYTTSDETNSTDPNADAFTGD